MMNELESRELTISLVEFRKLFTDSGNLKKLKENVYEGCSLSYDNKRLRFNDENLNALLRIIDRVGYMETLINLQMEAERKKEQENGSDV